MILFQSTYVAISIHTPMNFSSQVTLEFSKVSLQQTEAILWHMSALMNIVVVQNLLCCLTVSETAHHMELHIFLLVALMEFSVVQMVSNTVLFIF